MYQVSYFLTWNATMFPERLAVVHKDKKLTYRQLDRASSRLANSLCGLGVKKGDRVAFLLPNSLETVIVWYATQKIGATAVPVNSRLMNDEIAYILNDSNCAALIYHERFAETAEHLRLNCPALRQLICKRENPETESLDFDALIAAGSEKEPQARIDGEDESIILYTSGTTGKSKGVMHTQQMVREYSYMMAIENKTAGTPDTVLVQSPMFHLGGIQHLWRMAVTAGTVVLVNKIVPEEILNDIEKYRVTQLYILPPILLRRLYIHKGREAFDLSSVRTVMCAGGKCSRDISGMIFEMFPGASLRLSYGSTEIFGPTTAYLTEQMIAERPELAMTAGKINAQVELRIVDEAGNDCPDGEAGEALVRSPMIFTGYLNLPELNAKVIDSDGWFHTEDLLRRTPDGYYFVVDRKKDMIKSGGENVFAQEVESALRDHPAIVDCAVIGVPDQCMGEAVASAIVLSEGAVLDPYEFTDYCKSKMPSYRKPRYWAFLSELPANSVGKVQKSVLREHPEWFEKIIKD